MNELQRLDFAQQVASVKADDARDSQELEDLNLTVATLEPRDPSLSPLHCIGKIDLPQPGALALLNQELDEPPVFLLPGRSTLPDMRKSPALDHGRNHVFQICRNCHSGSEFVIIYSAK